MVNYPTASPLVSASASYEDDIKAGTFEAYLFKDNWNNYHNYRVVAKSEKVFKVWKNRRKELIEKSKHGYPITREAMDSSYIVASDFAKEILLQYANGNNKTGVEIIKVSIPLCEMRVYGGETCDKLSFLKAFLKGDKAEMHRIYNNPMSMDGKRQKEVDFFAFPSITIRNNGEKMEVADFQHHFDRISATVYKSNRFFCFAYGYLGDVFFGKLGKEKGPDGYYPIEKKGKLIGHRPEKNCVEFSLFNNFRTKEDEYFCPSFVKFGPANIVDISDSSFYPRNNLEERIVKMLSNFTMGRDINYKLNKNKKTHASNKRTQSRTLGD